MGKRDTDRAERLLEQIRPVLLKILDNAPVGGDGRCKPFFISQGRMYCIRQKQEGWTYVQKHSSNKNLH